MALHPNTEKAFQIARELYATVGVDADRAVQRLATIPISLPCWQGDDVGGFETVGAQLSGGGIQATGNYPGKARTIAELRRDFEEALFRHSRAAQVEPARVLSGE